MALMISFPHSITYDITITPYIYIIVPLFLSPQFLSQFLNLISCFHVLVVDDSIIDRKLIERLLKTSSYQVTAVESGVKALEFLGLLDHDNKYSITTRNYHNVEVNLIITDYSMPGLTGYELLIKIKETETLKDIPVVIMSSENIPSRINSCLEQGAEEFLLKPVQLSDVNKLRPHLMRQNQHNVTKKRKALDLENCFSPDRARARCNDLKLVQ